MAMGREHKRLPWGSLPPTINFAIAKATRRKNNIVHGPDTTTTQRAG